MFVGNFTFIVWSKPENYETSGFKSTSGGWNKEYCWIIYIFVALGGWLAD